jgi:exonuclease VII large subunit
VTEEARPTLREFFEERVDHLEQRIDQRFDGLERERKLLVDSNRAAIDKAENAVNQRLAQMNELREENVEWRLNTMSRAEVEQRFRALDEKIEQRFGALDEKIEQRFSSSDKKLDTLTDTVNLSTGRSSGSDASRAFLFALATAVAAIIGVVVLLTR